MVKDRLKKTCVKIDPIRVKQMARKHLREIASKSKYDRKKYSFKEYLNAKRKNDIILNQLIKDAQLDTDSSASLNQFLEFKEPGGELEEENKYDLEMEEETLEETNKSNNIVISRNRHRGVMNIEIDKMEEEENNKLENKEEKNNENIEEKNEDKNIEDNNDNNINKEEDKNNEENIITTNVNEEEKKEENSIINDNDNNNEMNEEDKRDDDKDDEIIGERNEELNEPPGPLDGKVIVITGETIVPKEYFRVLLARLGARVTFSVSSHTTLLIHGNRLEDGRKFFEGIKYKAAIEKDIPTYSDREFEEYMQELVKDRNWNLKDQVENMEGRDKIEVKKIKKTLMVTCPYSSAKGKKNRENRTRKRGNKKC